MIFCTQCGHQNDDQAQICANCGTALKRTAGSSASAPPYATPGSEAQSGPSWATPSYGASGYEMQQQPARPGFLSAVGENREPVMVLLLPFVTCGIYGMYWWYVTITEIKNALNRQDINPGMELVLGIVTCGIYFVYLAYKYPQLLLEMQDRVGLPRNDISTISLLLSVFGLYPVASFMIQTELNKIWDTARR